MRRFFEEEDDDMDYEKQQPGKTPGKAEGGEERTKPYPNAPGKTPGSAEGEDFDQNQGPGKIAGEELDDPGTSRSPDPNAHT